MQVTETETDGLKREYKVVVAAKDINDKLEARLQQVGEQVNVPGFRPGKVPLQILKQRFGQRVMGEVLEQAVRDSSSQAMAERGLRPAMQPKIEITAFDQDKDLEYTMAIELMPDIEVMDFAGVELERLKVEVPDEEVQEALERLASAQRKTEPLSEPRPAETGDVLVIDFRGSVDGEELPGMAAEGHHLELGSNQFVGTFEEQLVGIEKDESRQITVTFPEEYVNEKLAGKDAIFDVTVKDILASVPMAIDDGLAKALGEESLEGLKNQLRSQIEKDYGQFSRARMKRKLLDNLADGHDFPVPAGMVDTEFEVIWKQIEDDRAQGQADPEDEGKDDEALKAEYREIAERRVRLGLLLSEVGRQNNIDVSQDEVNQALVREAQRHPGHEREVFEFYHKSPEALASLRAPIYEDKVIDYITDLAQVSERSITADALRKEIEGEADAEEETETTAKAKGGKKAAAKKTTKAKTPAKAEKSDDAADNDGAGDSA